MQRAGCAVMFSVPQSRPASASSEPGAAVERPASRKTLWLGVGMAVSNVLGYVFTLIISRSLTPDDFGALSAIVGIGMLGSIPSGALQVVVARRISSGGDATGTTWLTSSLSVGLFAGAAAVAMPADRLFHLDSPWPVLWLGLMLVPMTATGTLQGILLGQHRLPALAATYVFGGVIRLGAGVGCAVFSAGVTDVVAATTVSAVTGGLFTFWVCRRRSPDIAMSGSVPGSLADLFAELRRSTTSLASLVALTTVDVLLARSYLTGGESGEYGLASLFGKVVFWGTQFVALAVVPRLVRGHQRRTLLLASALVVALGLAATALVAVDPEFWLRSVGGSKYADAGSLALAFTGLGTGWALAQVLVFGEMGRDRGHLARLIWFSTAAEVAVVVLWMHDSAGQVIATAAGATAVVIVGGLLNVARGDPAPLPRVTESAPTAVTPAPLR